jgi:uncharacterized protein (TIGR02444 family)
MAETVETKSSQGSPFWRFSLAFYRSSGVAEACIALQDGAGVDVNLLLFLLWNASRHRAFSASEIEDLERQIGPWRDAVVIPLRTIRRALKAPPPIVEAGTAEAFRTRIKATELEAERLQQEALYALSQARELGHPVASAADAARANVAAYQDLYKQPFPPAEVETLLAAFARMPPDRWNRG